MQNFPLIPTNSLQGTEFRNYGFFPHAIENIIKVLSFTSRT